MPDKKIFTLQDAVKQTGPKAFSIMVKPAGSACNLNCTYCYYIDKALQYGGREPLMSDELLETCIRQYIEACDVPEVNFCWHGGEPLLIGLPFFQKAMELQRKYADGKRVFNTIQTNGTLVDERWCDLFNEGNFLVGVSIDGPQDIHDGFRLDKKGSRTFNRVVESIRMMSRKGVEFNTLSVVNRKCEGRGLEIYRFLRDFLGSRYMQFLPAVEHVVDEVPDMNGTNFRQPATDGHPEATGTAMHEHTTPGKTKLKRPVIVPPEYPGARLAPWSVSAEGYGKFLCDIFDYWVRNDVGKVFVQMFDATLGQWCGVQPGVCSMCETCGDALVVEHNGDVYPCDHFVYPGYLLGNIVQTSLAEIFASEKRISFGLGKRNSLPSECLGCKWYFACRGECPKHRFATGTDGSLKNSLCEGFKIFFGHVAPYMDIMRTLLEHRQSPAGVMSFARGKI